MTSSTGNNDRPVSDLTRTVRETIEKNDIETVIVGGSDINGVFRGKRISAHQFHADPSAPVLFADYLLIMDLHQDVVPPPPEFEGWWPTWEGGFGDIDAIPDLASFRLAGWLDRTGVVLCDYQRRDGSPVIYSARQVLRRVVRAAEKLGYSIKIGPELEFYLFQGTTSIQSTREIKNIASDPSAYSILRGVLDQDFLLPLCRNLERSGIPVERFNPEGGIGQYEINLAYSDPLEAADRAFLFKEAVRVSAMQDGKIATFMAKPIAQGFGSSFHVHQSLWSETRENMFDDATSAGLSQWARSYIGGTLETLEDFTCLFAPTVNSYKRLVPYSAAGTSATWGRENRTAGIRVITGRKGGTRIELRTAGADANPYLVIAAAISGGLHGVTEKIDPPIETIGDAYQQASTNIPKSLELATERLSTSQVAAKYLGEDFVRYFAQTRRWEAQKYQAAVTDWEISRYFNPT
ncbi:glutamine synthetase family protein [Streptomyces sp. NPDC053431]|uniref:glutamine synthetase family protein n=1 Tax=Streptomyces sp. NPDC053431 TaxID=3365703 RepID=UPI0037D8F561